MTPQTIEPQVISLEAEAVGIRHGSEYSDGQPRMLLRFKNEGIGRPWDCIDLYLPEPQPRIGQRYVVVLSPVCGGGE